MWWVLNKVFIRSFYKANAGFFLFFFFIFFGAVEGSSLVSYHLSLMKSMLQSTTILFLVFLFWFLYHVKCAGHFLKVINGEEGKFLVNLQALSKIKQRIIYTCLYVAVSAPLLAYSIVVIVVGFKIGSTAGTFSILLFQVASVVLFTGIIDYRLNHWQQTLRLPVLRLPVQKRLSFLVLSFFINEKTKLLLLLKAFSLALLYIVLVWNERKYDNDAFLLFYVVLLLAHSAIPYFAVAFLENRFVLYRNLPLPLFKRAFHFLLPYLILSLPEAAYLFYNGHSISFDHKLAYVINLLANLFLLTAIQYSEAKTREEYLKASFGLLFISVFFLHVQAFWLWITIQFVIAFILFVHGYYSFEKTAD